MPPFPTFVRRHSKEKTEGNPKKMENRCITQQGHRPLDYHNVFPPPSFPFLSPCSLPRFVVPAPQMASFFDEGKGDQFLAERRKIRAAFELVELEQKGVCDKEYVSCSFNKCLISCTSPLGTVSLVRKERNERVTPRRSRPVPQNPSKLRLMYRYPYHLIMPYPFRLTNTQRPA